MGADRAWTLLLNAEGEPRGVLTDDGGGTIFGHCDGERVRVVEVDDREIMKGTDKEAPRAANAGAVATRGES